MMIDPKINGVEMSYDPVSDEYARRIFIEFRQGDMRRLDVEDGSGAAASPFTRSFTSAGRKWNTRVGGLTSLPRTRDKQLARRQMLSRAPDS
jgi:hypothetical protein